MDNVEEGEPRQLSVSKSRKKLMVALELEEVIAADPEVAEQKEITKVETRLVAEKVVFSVFSDILTKAPPTEPPTVPPTVPPTEPLTPRSPPLRVDTQDVRPDSGGKSYKERGRTPVT
jgi:hypothetical protein